MQSSERRRRAAGRALRRDRRAAVPWSARTGSCPAAAHTRLARGLRFQDRCRPPASSRTPSGNSAPPALRCQHKTRYDPFPCSGRKSRLSASRSATCDMASSCHPTAILPASVFAQGSIHRSLSSSVPVDIRRHCGNPNARSGRVITPCLSRSQGDAVALASRQAARPLRNSLRTERSPIQVAAVQHVRSRTPRAFSSIDRCSELLVCQRAHTGSLRQRAWLERQFHLEQISDQLIHARSRIRCVRQPVHVS